MRRKLLSLLLIFMFCLVACDGAIEEDDDDFDEPIAAEQDDEAEELGDEFDDEAEELDEALDDEQEDADMDAGNEEDSAESPPATIEEFDALFTDQLGYDLATLDDAAFLDVVQQELGFDSAEEAEMYLADLFGDEGSDEDAGDEPGDNEDGGSENFSGDGLITFIKKINVFGAEIWATDDISDEQLLYAAVIMAEYLDNDEDGVPDNPLITDVMEERNATLLMYVEAKFDTLDLEMVDEARGFAQQPLFRNQVSLEGITPTSFDTTYEEVLHLITTHGWAYAYPDVWGESTGSELANAMDMARGGRFEQVPEEYPEEAWYSYDDVTCEYECMAGEYVYWAYTSLLGAQQYRMDKIDHEWRLGTAELLHETDTAIVDLLTDPEFNFGMVLPDGDYDAIPLEIEPISFESNTEAQDDEAEELGEEQDDEADLDDDSRSSILGFGDPNDSHIGGTVLRRPAREAPDDIYTDSGIYFTDEFGQYNKAMEVYGLTFIAREEMPDQFMLQVAETLKAMFIQTDETDRELQEAVLKEMYRYYAVLPIVSIAQFSDIGDLGDQEDAASFADIIMNDVETGQVNEVVEHILHAVTSVGMHYALNGEFGLHEDSTVTQAMREATELGYFNYVSGEPEGSAEDSKIRVQEYVYWVIVTGWNIQERYYSGGEEWTIRNADALQAQQPFAYELFADYIPKIMTAPSEAVLQPFEVDSAGATQVDEDSEPDFEYTAATFTVDGDTAVMSGVIDGTTPDRVQELIDNYPEVTMIVMQLVEGSVDDDANLIAARLVRQYGFDTYVPSNGKIASGGVDFFLAGVERSIDDGAKLGVHSWANGDTTGADVPRDNPQHSLYLDYYDEMDIPADFYWFTLEAAPAEDIHWMSSAEIDQYEITTR